MYEITQNYGTLFSISVNDAILLTICVFLRISVPFS